MSIYVYGGLPGSGKSTKLARKALESLQNNEKIFKKYGYRRKTAVNFPLSRKLKSKYKDYIIEWSDPNEIMEFVDTDIFIDEIAIYFDAQNWADISQDVKKWLRLHRHYGIKIYGVAQDFDTIDVSFRRLVNELYMLYRLAGTKEPSPHLPKSTLPWVWSLQKEVDPITYGEKKEEYKFIGTSWNLFRRKDFAIFDTRAKFVTNNVVPMKHIAKKCLTCGYEHVTHR